MRNRPLQSTQSGKSPEIYFNEFLFLVNIEGKLNTDILNLFIYLNI